MNKDSQNYDTGMCDRVSDAEVLASKAEDLSSAEGTFETFLQPGGVYKYANIKAVEGKKDI